MKKINVLFVFLLLLLSVANAQKINWSTAIKASKGYEPKIVGEDATSFYTCSGSSKELVIEKYEKASLKNLFSKKYELPKNHSLEKAVLAGDKILLFFSGFDSGKKVAQVYCNTYSSVDGSKMGQPTILFASALAAKERSAGVEHGQRAFYDNEKYVVLTAPSAKRILIIHKMYDDKQEKHTNSYILLDTDLNKIVEKKEEMTRAEDSKFYVSGMTLDDAGSLYFFKNEIGGGYKTSLMCYDAGKSYDSYIYELDPQKLNISESSSLPASKITFDKDGNLVVIGEYIRNDVFAGYYFLKYDAVSKKIAAFKINEFSRSFKEQFLTASEIKKGKNSVLPRGFTTLDLIATDNGGFVGTADISSHGELTRRVKQGNFVTNEHIGEYHLYRDIIAVNFSSDGTMLWANRVPNNQLCKYKYVNTVGRDNAYFSHFSAISNNKLFIAFNDLPDNAANTDLSAKPKKFKSPDGSVITLFTINLSTGEKTKSVFQQGMSPDVIPEPDTFYQQQQNSELILIGSKANKFKVGVMGFDK